MFVNDIAQANKIIKILIFAIIAIIIAIIIAAVVIILWPYKPSFTDAENNIIARDHIREYRRQVSDKTKIVWYDTSDIRTYLDKHFPTLVGNLKGDPNCTNCKWVVGFYLMRKYDQGTPRNSFFVIPTLVDTTKREVYDFIDPKHISVYSSKNGPTAQNDDSDSLAFNRGHIWP